MHIAFVTGLYPSKSRPNYGTFVQQLVRVIAKKGIMCTVISPTSIFEMRYGCLDPEKQIDALSSEIFIQEYRPRFISASAKKFFMFNTAELSYQGFSYAAEGVLKSIAPQIDCIYGHFLYPSGRFVSHIGEILHKPSFAAHGDDSIGEHDMLRGGNDFKNMTGIIAVSNRNKQFCIEHLSYPAERIAVFPNGVDRKVFHLREKRAMRDKYNLPHEKTLVAFVGHFIERKGPNRVLEAIEPLDNVAAVMVGAGPVPLISDKIAFRGPTSNEKVAELLSACDIFVLPTLNEGCCNAILEALTCGLPVITSIGDFNDEIVNDRISLRVNPMSIKEIRNAIAFLMRNSEKRNEMSNRAIEFSMRYSLEDRADKIVAWMIERVASAKKGIQ